MERHSDWLHWFPVEGLVKAHGGCSCLKGRPKSPVTSTRAPRLMILRLRLCFRTYHGRLAPLGTADSSRFQKLRAYSGASRGLFQLIWISKSRTTVLVSSDSCLIATPQKASKRITENKHDGAQYLGEVTAQVRGPPHAAETSGQIPAFVR